MNISFSYIQSDTFRFCNVVWNVFIQFITEYSVGDAVAISLTDCLDSGSYHGPRWRMEPADLFIPVDSIEEEATLTCDAKGTPPSQYR